MGAAVRVGVSAAAVAGWGARRCLWLKGWVWSRSGVGEGVRSRRCSLTWKCKEEGCEGGGPEVGTLEGGVGDCGDEMTRMSWLH